MPNAELLNQVKLEKNKQKRISGIDISKGISIFGMIFMNFKIAGKYLFASKEITYDYTYSLLDNMSGRFGSLFIFLAGMGVVLMNKRALNNNDNELFNKNRIKLLKRSLFLFIIGMIFSIYWKADILHYYAFYILIGTALLKLKRSKLIILAVICMVIFVPLNFFLSWENGWDFNILEYTDFYTFRGFFRNLLFNGFHPIFPWMSFFLTGMAVAKSDMSNKKHQYTAIILSFITFTSVEFISYTLSHTIQNPDLKILLSSNAMPPFFFYVISSTAMNIFTLNIGIIISRNISESNILIKSLINTGKMTMTHYVFHLLFGIVVMYLINNFIEINTVSVFIYSSIYFVFTLLITQLWRRFFNHGPLEALMRKITD